MSELVEASPRTLDRQERVKAGTRAGRMIISNSVSLNVASLPLRTVASGLTVILHGRCIRP